MYATIQSRRCSLLPFAQPSPVSVGGIMCAAPVPNWRQLAEAASKETDHNKLLKIVGQLCDSLDKVHTNEQTTGQVSFRGGSTFQRKWCRACIFRPEQLKMRDTDSKLVISVGTPPDLLSPREAVRNFYPHAPKVPKLFGRHLTCENSALNSR